MDKVSCSFLGPPIVKRDGIAVKLETRKALALLAYLSVTGEQQSRDTLATLLWPDAGQAAGRTSLRHLLYSLTRSLGADGLVAERESVGMDSNGRVQIDTKDFRHLLDQCTGHCPDVHETCPQCLGLLESADALYRGDFLHGFTLRDSATFDDWQGFQTEKYRGEHAAVLERLVSALSSRAELPRAILYARRWLQADPLNETAHCWLMRLYDTNGNHAAALRQYQECVRVLREELGGLPSELTVRLYEQIKAAVTIPRAGVAVQPRGHPSNTVGPRRVKAERCRGAEGRKAELIGRHEELGRMERALDSLADGKGWMVCLTGDAGIGKSRLIAELKRYASAQPESGRGPVKTPLWLEGRCQANGAPYWPIRDMLRGYLLTLSGDPPRRHAQAFHSGLGALVRKGVLTEASLRGIGPYLANLLSAPLKGGWGELLETSSPETIRNRTFAAVEELLGGLVRQMPLVLVLEDLHWADILSLDLLSALVELVATKPLLLICVSRPRLDRVCHHLAATGSRRCGDRYTEIPLQPLGAEDAVRLRDALLKGRRLPAVAGEQILAKSQGNPFFIQELVHYLGKASRSYGAAKREAEGGGAVSGIPQTIASVILDGLDSLPQELKETLTVAAVIGRLFRRDLLERVMTAGAEEGRTTQEILWELEDRGLVVQERAFPAEEYSFNHVITQEAIYGNLVPAARRDLHGRVARAFENIEDSAQADVEEIAHHYSRSENSAKAVEYLLKAGKKAWRQAANATAVSYYQSGRRLLLRLAETEERKRLELELLLSLGVSLSFTKGHPSTRVAQAYALARELAAQVGEVGERFQAAVGLRRYHLLRGDLGGARALDEELVRLGEQARDAAVTFRAQLMKVETSLYAGDFPAALDQCRRAEGLSDPNRELEMAHRYGTAPTVMLGAVAQLALWHSGFPEQALTVSRNALAQAESIHHPISIMYAKLYHSFLRQFRREAVLAGASADEVLFLSRAQGNTLIECFAAVVSGWSQAMRGDPRSGIKEMERYVAAARSGGIAGWHGWMLGFLAEACLAGGSFGRALEALTQALEQGQRSGEGFWRAELLRLKGEVLLRIRESAQRTEAPSVDAEQIETVLLTALETARAQGALSLELRAAVSLGRFWTGQGHGAEARRLVRQVLARLTEDSDSPDFADAKKLIAAVRN
jgi:DNA-binding SARP family transcriptional activator